MKGQILEFTIQSNSGMISSEDGSRYSFTGADWKGNRPPQTNMTVEFTPDGKQARGISVIAAASSRDKVVAGVLAIVLGGFGAHKFYLGFVGPALVYLLVNTIGLLVTWIFGFLPNYVLWVIALVEGIIYLTKSDEEFEQTYVVEKKQWF
ncbi:MAG: TM2 domain-containing protein [Chitinispirillaceae bacterium]